jgi:hypothetical protein
MNIFRRKNKPPPPPLPVPPPQVISAKEQLDQELLGMYGQVVELVNDVALQILRPWKTPKQVMEDILFKVVYTSGADSAFYCKCSTDGAVDYAVLDCAVRVANQDVRIGARFSIEKILPTLAGSLYNNELIVIHHDDKTIDSSLLATWDLKTMVIIPIGLEEKIYGCVGIVYRGRKQEIYPQIKTILSTVGRLITVYIKKQHDSFIHRQRRENHKQLVGGVAVYTWNKDRNGSYLHLDDNWVCKFYPGMYKHLFVLGMTDMVAIQQFRSVPGHTHTFGEICVGSDDITYGLNTLTHYWELGSINGTPLLLHVVKRPQYDEAGRVIGINGLAYDITHLGLSKFYAYADELIANGVLVVHSDDRALPIGVFRFTDDQVARMYQLTWMLDDLDMPSITM